nr:alpha/beta hydrolase [Limimaricola litoreus]
MILCLAVGEPFTKSARGSLMHALLKTTTASAALAAALSVSPATLSAQETATDDSSSSETSTATDTASAPDTRVEVQANVTADAGAVADPPASPNEDMQAVLDKLADLGAQPISELSVEEARSQPTPADAVMALMEERGIEMPEDLAGIATRDITYPGADGSEIDARVYTPAEGEGPFPLIVYYHGGGWVIAGIDVYDASARALAASANAVVVSATYRQAPGAIFPTQHEDASAAYEWIVENSGAFNADAERLAIAGESAGGNLALNVAIHARDAELIQPDHVLSVYPIASDDMQLPSYEAYADAMPLSRDGMEWFFDKVFEDPSQASDPRIDLISRDDLQGLPPVTIVNAEIDPLQSEGEIMAERLAEAGVEVEQMTYDGVTHEFFGMGTVVPQAQEAVDMAVANLREAFGSESDMDAGATTDAGMESGEGSETDAMATDAPAAMQTEGDTNTGTDGTADPADEDATTTGN